MFLSIIQFYAWVYQAPLGPTKDSPMRTLASGGNAVASPPDPLPPSSTPGHGGDKGALPDWNPGKQSDVNLGAPATMVVSTSPSVSMASLTQTRSGMEGLNQDTYVTGQPVAMFTQDAMDTEEPQEKVPGVSLASSQEHGPPCHWPSPDDKYI
jgi:hypothetical protein